jgi:DNA mismatch repair ATPase MutS
VLAIPYNLISLGDKVVGADARFWHSLEKDFRKLLLLRLESFLKDLREIRGTPCILDKVVTGSQQAEELRSLRRSLESLYSNEVSRERSTERNPFKLFSLRIASLIIPGKRIYKRLENEVYDEDLREIRVARSLAEQLDLYLARSLERTLYLHLEVDVKNKDFSVRDRIYSSIIKMDETFRNDLKVEIRRCLGASI